MSFGLILSATKKKSILSPQSIVSKSPIIYELSEEEPDSKEDKENNFQVIRYLSSIFTCYYCFELVCKWSSTNNYFKNYKTCKEYLRKESKYGFTQISYSKTRTIDDGDGAQKLKREYYNYWCSSHSNCFVRVNVFKHFFMYFS